MGKDALRITKQTFMKNRIILGRKSVAVKPVELSLRSGKTYSPSFSSEDITYKNVSPGDLEELLITAGKKYGVSVAQVTDEGSSDEGYEVNIGE